MLLPESTSEMFRRGWFVLIPDQMSKAEASRCKEVDNNILFSSRLHARKHAALHVFARCLLEKV
jgi:hypothetical protein